MYQEMASLGLSSWMSGILVVVWTSRGGLELVHYLGESRMLPMGVAAVGALPLGGSG